MIALRRSIRPLSGLHLRNPAVIIIDAQKGFSE